MKERNNEQKLVDLCFEIAMAVWMEAEGQKFDTHEDVAERVAHLLRENGFDTKPAGASWGVLQKEGK